VLVLGVDRAPLRKVRVRMVAHVSPALARHTRLLANVRIVPNRILSTMLIRRVPHVLLVKSRMWRGRHVWTVLVRHFRHSV
jgi:hypothetical protein